MRPLPFVLASLFVLPACDPYAPAEGPPPSHQPPPTTPGPTPTHGPGGACGDGTGPEVPPGYPTLGTGCRSHFTYKWHYLLFDSRGTADEVDARGVRRIAESPFTGTYDLGSQSTSKDGYHPVVMFLPSLEVGVYDASNTGLQHVLLGTHGSDVKNGRTGVRVEIVGARPDAVWGRFLGRVCEVGSSKDDCYHFEEGRFSAARDAAPSDFEFGYPIKGGSGLELCETRADCPSHGSSIPPLCTQGVCTGAAPGPM